MNDILKQRLVGALVLIVLGVVFWPVIFVGPEIEPMDRASQVPGIPSLREMQLDAPEQVGGIPPARREHSEPTEEVIVDELPAAEVAASETVEDTEAKKPAAEPIVETPPVASTPIKPKLDEQGIPVAWTLQIVTARSRGKAEALVDELIAAKNKAYYKAVSRGEGTLYRVYVGPKFDKAQLLDLKSTIDSKYRVNSIVRRYLP